MKMALQRTATPTQNSSHIPENTRKQQTIQKHDNGRQEDISGMPNVIIKTSFDQSINLVYY